MADIKTAYRNLRAALPKMTAQKAYVIARKAVTENDRKSAHGANDSDPDNRTIRDCAATADRIAETYAEREREYDTAWQAGARWCDIGIDMRETRHKIRQTLKDIRAVQSDIEHTGMTAYAHICDALREKIRDWLDDIEDMRNERAALASGDADGFMFYPSKDVIASFNEGAGKTVIC